MTGELGGRYLEFEGKDITNMWNIYIYRMFLYVHILFIIYIYYVYIHCKYLCDFFSWSHQTCRVCCRPPFFRQCVEASCSTNSSGGMLLRLWRQFCFFVCSTTILSFDQCENQLFFCFFFVCVCVSLVIWMCSCVWRFFLNGVNKKIVLNYKPIKLQTMV